MCKSLISPRVCVKRNGATVVCNPLKMLRNGYSCVCPPYPLRMHAASRAAHACVFLMLRYTYRHTFDLLLVGDKVASLFLAVAIASRNHSVDWEVKCCG